MSAGFRHLSPFRNSLKKGLLALTSVRWRTSHDRAIAGLACHGDIHAEGPHVQAGLPATEEVTHLLRSWSRGNTSALNQLTPLVYGELQRLARCYMRGEGSGHTLPPSALVNEAYLRLIGWKNVRWQNREHFIGVAARLMRHVLVDYARASRRAKRGGSFRRVSLDEAAAISAERRKRFAPLHDALRSLEYLYPRKSKTIELRYFAGLSVEETAEVLKVSPRTVMRDCNLARRWLQRELCGATQNGRRAKPGH